LTQVARARSIKVGVGNSLETAVAWHHKGADLFLVAIDTTALAGALSAAIADHAKALEGAPRM